MTRAGAHRADRARTMGYLQLSGGLLGFLALALPRARGFDTTGIAVLAALACAGGVAAFIGLERLGRAAIHALAAYGTVLVTLAIYFDGRSSSPFAIFYLWVILYVFYFFAGWATSVHLAFVSACYAGVLAVLGNGETPATRWLVTSGTFVVAGVLIAQLRRRVISLIDQLAEVARTDALTGLLNRRGFEEAFGLELERARRGGRPLTLIVGDLDGFKRVNDRHGHPAGDMVLATVGRVLLRGRRRIDIVARIGGEEFALIAGETDTHGAQFLAERLRRDIREGLESTPEPLTMSWGIAGFPEHGATLEELMGAADRALYASKGRGGDTTTVARPSDEQERPAASQTSAGSSGG